MSGLIVGLIVGFVIGLFVSFAFGYNRAVYLYRDRAIDRAVEQADKDQHSMSGSMVVLMLFIVGVLMIMLLTGESL